MSKITDAEANATSLDGLVNDNGLITTLRNGPKPSYQYLVDGWTIEVNELLDRTSGVGRDNTYETTAIGIAATVDGDYFNVVSPDDENYLDLYKNESGIAVYKKSYPSTDGLAVISSLTDEALQKATNNEINKAGLYVGKNKINQYDLTEGFYIDYLDGQPKTLTGRGYTDYIELNPNTLYNLSAVGGGGTQQFALYDENKLRVGGFAAASTKYPFNTTSDTKYARFTLYLPSHVSSSDENMLVEGDYPGKFYPFTKGIITSEILDEQITTDKISDESVTTEKLVDKAVTADKLADESITTEKLSQDLPFMTSEVGKNLLDRSSFTDGGYVRYDTGTIANNATFAYSDYIDLEPDTIYNISAVSGEVLQFAMYDENDVFVSGVIGGGEDESFTTAANVVKGRFSIRISGAQESNMHMLVKGSYPNQYIPYEKGVADNQIGQTIKSAINYKNEVIVNQDGSGDFTTLRGAVDYIDSLLTAEPTDIVLHEGTYSVFDDYTAVEINDTNFIGVRLNDYVSLRGFGDKSKTIVEGYLDDTFSDATKLRVSTIAMFGTGDFENVTITARQLRYAVHDDYPRFYDVKRRVINSDFILYAGNGGATKAYGSGGFSGGDFYFESSRCYSYVVGGMGIGFHNNVNFTKPLKFKAVNCEFASDDNSISAYFQALDSGTVDTIELIGCRLKGDMIYGELGGAAPWKISGYANTPVPTKIYENDYSMIGETMDVVSGEAISSGDPIKIVDNDTAFKLTSSDEIHLLDGIAINDASVGENVVIQYAGTMHNYNTNLPAFAAGDKLGIVGGDVSVVVSGEYFAVGRAGGYLKFK